MVKNKKVLVMNNIYIRPKNLHKISLENLSIRNLGNSVHNGCLKKKE